MYTAFYGLREKPFALSPDPRYLYLAGSHREALAHLLYGIEQGEGFISVTGEVGTGKTTLCRTLLERLDGDTELAFLFNPSRTALELLQSICAEFDLPAEGLARRSLMTQLDGFLVEQKRLGRRVLLIIDEAQTLSENTLEQVRLLSNLETSREKLIQILLLGQPELDRKLDSQNLRQLRQRISVRWKLEPLSPEETRAYVRHRIAIAAGQPKELFSEAALRQIHRRTGGVPRLINQLCDRALLGGYAARKAQIGSSLIRAAAREIPDAQPGLARDFGRSRWASPWLVVAASLAVLTIATFAGLQVGRHGLTNAGQALFSGSGLSLTDRLAPTSSDSRAIAMQRLAAANTAANTDNTGSAAPNVGANAPTNSNGRLGTTSTANNPPLARMIGYVQPEEAASDPRQGSTTNLESNPFDESPAFVASAVALPIPTPPRPEITALAPGLLPTLLENRDSKVAMAESQRAVLEAFGRRVPALASTPDTVVALQSGIEDRGLTATPFDGGTIDLLRRLDHPVLLPLAAFDSQVAAQNDPAATPDLRANGPNSEPRWLAVIGFAGDRARLSGLISDRIVTVPVSELADHWLETGIIVWERYEPTPEMLFVGEEGPGVQWLQRSLAELRIFNGKASGQFDDDTRNALIQFQRKHGLVADGIAGPLTQIALYGNLDRYPVPRLSNAAVSATAAPTSSTPPTPPTPPTRAPARQRVSTPTAHVPDSGNPSRVQGTGDRG